MSKKPSLPKKNRNSAKTSSVKTATIRTGDISKVEGEVNIAARDIIKNIQMIYERSLTPHKIDEKDLQIEIGALKRGVREYLKGLKQQVLVPAMAAPYKGLEAFTLSDAGVFFGRDRAVRDLREAIPFPRTIKRVYP